MDWNNDGRVDGRDYAHYKSVINTSGSSSGSSSSGEGLGAAGWLILIGIAHLIINAIVG